MSNSKVKDTLMGAIKIIDAVALPSPYSPSGKYPLTTDFLIKTLHELRDIVDTGFLDTTTDPNQKVDIITPAEAEAVRLLERAGEIQMMPSDEKMSHEHADKIITLAEKIKAQRLTIAMLK